MIGFSALPVKDDEYGQRKETCQSAQHKGQKKKRNMALRG